MIKFPTDGVGVSPSMEGATDDDVLALADHLHEHVPLGHDAKEAMRMANAGHLRPDLQVEMRRSAVEIAMHELISEAEKAA